MNSYVARQPILDKNLKIFAYELLFRSDSKANSFSDINADRASSKTIMESFYSIGIDTITGRKPAFINFTETLLLENIATLFPKQLLVIELLENIEPTQKIIDVCRELVKRGYTIALDDFVYKPEFDPLIELCKIIKFDFLLSTPKEIKKMLKHMKVEGKRLLAEKIETQEMYKLAADMGFTLFQGYFFSKPVTMTSKSLTPLKVNYMTLFKEMNAGHDMDFNKIEKTIRRDVALCHNLLRMANSVYYGMRSEVTDIKRALTVLGTKEIRKWIYLMAMMDMGSHKPDELIKMSLIRGIFMEHIAEECDMLKSKETMFLIGMFSLIDVLMDRPMNDALADLVLAPEVGEALIANEGHLYNTLRLVISIEECNWDETDSLCEIISVDKSLVSDLYLRSVKWCNEMLN